MSTADLAIHTGDIVASKYRVERVLGMGAMGVVVAAMHVDLDERRALKILRPQLASHPEAIERFLREARSAARLKSQHVARVHDMGRLPSGAPYLVMEYLEGTDLKALLASRRRLPAGEATRYLLQACEAIGEAHRHGIVHRDLKPANLFLTRGASGAPLVKVLDFGIAKVRTPEGGGDITGGESLLGTPLYMSPEQMRGASSVDGRSDIWSLGAILYELTTGELPFSGGSVTAICAAVIADPPRPPRSIAPDLSPAFEAIILKCLEKKASERYESISELVFALRPFSSPSVAPSFNVTMQRASSPSAPPPSVPPQISPAASTAAHNTAHTANWAGVPDKTPPKTSSKRLVFVGLALAALGAAGAGAFALTRGTPKSTPGKRTATAAVSVPAESAVATSSVAEPPTVSTSSAPPTPSSASSALVSSSASASASSAPTPSATVRGAGTPPPPPPPFIPVIPPMRPPDAFGNDRK